MAAREGVESARFAAAGRLPRHFFDEFLRLSKTLIHGPAFQLAFVDCPSSQDRRVLLVALDPLLRQAGLSVERLPLGPKLHDAAALEARLRQPARADVVHLLGAERWFNRPRWDALNLLRERLAHEVGGRLVFWLDAESIKMIVAEAPDLWAWRSGVYAFRPSADAMAPSPAKAMPALGVGDKPIADAPSARARWQRIVQLRDWLSAPPAHSEPLQGPVLEELSELLADVGDWPALLEHLEQRQIPFFEARGEQDRVLTSRLDRARVLNFSGRSQEACVEYERLVEPMEQSHNVPLTARFWSDHARALDQLGRRDEALALRRDRQVPLLEGAAGAPREWLAHAASGVVKAMLQLGRTEEAQAYFDAHLRPCLDASESPETRALAHETLVHLRRHQGRTDDALTLLRDEVLPLWRASNAELEVAHASMLLADLLEGIGRSDDAAAVLRKDALSVWDRRGDADLAAMTRWRLGQLLGRSNVPAVRADGLAQLQAAAQEARRLSAPWREAVEADLRDASRPHDKG